MYKQSKSMPASKGKCFPRPAAPVGKDLMGVNPLKQQFEPTPAAPMRQRYKMAGGT